MFIWLKLTFNTTGDVEKPTSYRLNSMGWMVKVVSKFANPVFMRDFLFSVFRRAASWTGGGYTADVGSGNTVNVTCEVVTCCKVCKFREALTTSKP